MPDYKATIGIETHVQLKTKTKLFSSVDNDARSAKPNSLISHIDVGMPGALPVLNQKAVELACRAAYALNTEPQKFSKFDRKHYFYPDLPKGYQITQHDQPIIKGGYVEIMAEGVAKKIGITRAHLEEDAGKNTHPAGSDYTLVDLNRAGTPLLEIVSEPDIANPVEAKAFARELYLLMKYSDVSDVDLHLGHMRFDVNVSVSNNGKPGVRTETKNLNSFRSVESAVAYEIKRQTEEAKKGNKIVQETRGWDEAKQKTVSQRGKEEAHDYRYMPEPDIPPLVLSDEFMDKQKEHLPDLPNDLRAKLKKIVLTTQLIEDLLDRPVRLEHVLRVHDKGNPAAARRAAFWVLAIDDAKLNLEKALLNMDEPVIELSEMLGSGKLNSTAADQIYVELPHTDKPPTQLADELGLLQISDESAIERIVERVVKDNSKVVNDIKAGEEKAIGFLIGQVMAASKGAANPNLTQKIIKQKLGI